MAFDKCYDEKVPELFKAMPDEVKKKEAVVKMALEKCFDQEIHELFIAIPDEVKANAIVLKMALEAVVKMAVDKCKDYFIPELFKAMPDEVKKKAAAVKLALEKCNQFAFVCEEDVVKMAWDKCSSNNLMVPEMFSAMPDEYKRNDTVVKMAFDKCYESCVPELFKAMPDEVKTKEAVVKMAFDNCSDEYVPELFEAMPEEVKTKEDFVKMAWDKCRSNNSQIPEMFSAMPDEYKRNDDVVKMSIEKCSDDEMHKLFEAIRAQMEPNATPAELKQLKEYVLLAVDGMDALSAKALQDFQEFQTRLPAELPHDKDIQSAFERKKVMELPFHKKYRKLLQAAVEVSITYLLVLGSIEGAIWFQKRSGGKIANWSNQHWKNKTDFEEVHFEIFDGCVLSAAPQPFDIALPVTSLKLVVITAAFGFITRNLMLVQNTQEKTWKLWVAVGMMVYSAIMIPFSMILLVLHFVQNVSPQIQGGFGKKYECFFAIVNLAPFQTNYLMYLVQFLAGVVVSHSAGLDMYHLDRADQCLIHTKIFTSPRLEAGSCMHRVVQHIRTKLGLSVYMPEVVEYISRKLRACFSRKFPSVAKETLVQPLLDDGRTIGQMQEFKVTGKFMLFALTLAPYLCVETPFIITHKIPAAALFFPFIILIISVTGCIFAIVNRDLLRNWRILMSREGAQHFDTWLKEVEEAGYMPIVPALWGLLVINEFLTLAPIYWYGGAGWFESGVMVLVERSVWIYFNVFLTKIMSKYWSAASFINEIS